MTQISTTTPAHTPRRECGWTMQLPRKRKLNAGNRFCDQIFRRFGYVPTMRNSDMNTNTNAT